MYYRLVTLQCVCATVDSGLAHALISLNGKEMCTYRKVCTIVWFIALPIRTAHILMLTSAVRNRHQVLPNGQVLHLKAPGNSRNIRNLEGKQ